jgi:hypothetical protein
MPNHLKSSKNIQPLRPLLYIVAANYLAQIPYYLHQYYLSHHLLPNLVGSLLLLATLLWFITACRLLMRGSKAGWWLLSGYLAAVFLFYVQTQIMQLATAHQILLYVYHPKNALLFAVFGIGYSNCLAAIAYLVYLIARRQELLAAHHKS